MGEKIMLQNKVALVTGANEGMGKVIAAELARQGATVVMISRNRQKGEMALREIVSATGSSSPDLLVADLSSQQAIRQLVKKFQQRYAHLHILVNNAGAHVQQRQVNVDGIEMNLAINHLAGFLLNNLLLETMRGSGSARIINTASSSVTRSINLNDLQSEQTFEPWTAYGQAKLAVVFCTYALAQRLTGTGITVNALDPGIVATGIIGKVAPPIARPFVGLIKLFLQTPEKGAQTALYLATSVDVEGTTGKYFIKGKQRPSVPISYDEALQERVWNISAGLVGLKSSVM